MEGCFFNRKVAIMDHVLDTLSCLEILISSFSFSYLQFLLFCF